MEALVMRRLLCSFLLIFSLASALAAEVPWAVLSDQEVAVEYRNGTYFASLSLRVEAVPEVVQEVLTDFDHMSSFVPNLKASRLLSRNGQVLRIWQQGEAQFGLLSFPFESERLVELFPDGRLVAQAVAGTSKYQHSEMRFQSIAGGTQLDYRIEVIPDHWMPALLGIRFMRHELAEQFSAIAREMMRRQKLRPAG